MNATINSMNATINSINSMDSMNATMDSIDMHVINHIAAYAATIDYIETNPRFIWDTSIYRNSISIVLFHVRNKTCSTSNIANRSFILHVKVNVNRFMKICIGSSRMVHVAQEQLLSHIERTISDPVNNILRGTLTPISTDCKVRILLKECRRMFDTDVISGTFGKTQSERVKVPIMIPAGIMYHNFASKLDSELIPLGIIIASPDRMFVWDMIALGEYNICRRDVFSVVTVFLIKFDISRTNKNGSERSEPAYRVCVYENEILFTTRTAVNISAIVLTALEIAEITDSIYSGIKDYAPTIIDQIQRVLRHPNARMLFDDESRDALAHITDVLGERMLC